MARFYKIVVYLIFISRKSFTFSGFLVYQSAPCLTTNILMLATRILSFYLNPMILSSSESSTWSSVKISVSETFFFFIFDEIDYHMYLNTFQFIVFLYLAFQCIIGFFFHVFFLLLFVFWRHIFWYSFPYSVIFCIPCRDILW